RISQLHHRFVGGFSEERRSILRLVAGSGKLVRVLAVVGVAGAAAAAGTIGLAAAQTGTTTPPASSAPSSSTPAPDHEGHRGPGGRVGEFGGIAGNVLHGEFVVPKDNGFETLDIQTGKATAVSSSSITVVSGDNFSKTYA